jgi:hypothetical protein
VADHFEMSGRDDRRRQTRKPTRIRAWADPGGVAPAADCVIVDLSEDGACVASVNGAPLPNKFKLQVDAKSDVGDAEVMWRGENAVGVKFEKPTKD